MKELYMHQRMDAIAQLHLPYASARINIRAMHKRTVSTVLRELLDRDGLSPTELHRRTEVPQSTISRILSGKIADPADKHISKIAEYFRVNDTVVILAALLPFYICYVWGGRLRQVEKKADAKVKAASKAQRKSEKVQSRGRKP